MKLELSKSAERLNELEKTQLSGDFSIELSRKINVLRYHIEFLENRLDGSFEAFCTLTPVLPEGRGLNTENYQN